MNCEKSFIKQIGSRLRQVRQNKGWTLEETEQHGYPSWRHLQKLETGKNFNMSTLYKICEVYGLSPSELLATVK